MKNKIADAAQKLHDQLIDENYSFLEVISILELTKSGFIIENAMQQILEPDDDNQVDMN